MVLDTHYQSTDNYPKIFIQFASNKFLNDGNTQYFNTHALLVIIAFGPILFLIKLPMIWTLYVFCYTYWPYRYLQNSSILPLLHLLPQQLRSCNYLSLVKGRVNNNKLQGSTCFMHMCSWGLVKFQLILLDY